LRRNIDVLMKRRRLRRFDLLSDAKRRPQECGREHSNDDTIISGSVFDDDSAAERSIQLIEMIAGRFCHVRRRT
jgi:hypothetical protein